MSISDSIPSADLLTKRLIPLSAIIVAFFMLLWSMLGGNKMDHAELERQGKLTVKILWGMCTNSAAVIQDEALRIAALTRCIPDEPSIADKDQAYLFDGILGAPKVVAADKPKTALSGWASASARSSAASSIQAVVHMKIDRIAKLIASGAALDLQ